MLNAYFGLNAQIVALCIMAISYIIIFTEKINRAIVALFGGAMMVIFGVLSQSQAIKSVDFNTINLLIGMMIIVAITEKTGVFQFIAVWVSKKIKANPRALMATMSLITALLSGYVDNVTTVLLITPVLLKLTNILDVKPFPYLLTMIFACNIGGAATLIGDPPNILVGTSLNLEFMDFIENMTPISYLLTAVLIGSFDLIWGRKLKATEANRAKVMKMHAYAYLTDKKLLAKSLAVLALVIAAFVFAHPIGLETGTIAILGATTLMLLYTFGDFHSDAEDKMRDIFASVDWVTIFFFAGLFIIVAGLEVTGTLEQAGHKFVELTGGDFHKTLHIFLWSAAGLSAIIDNIPFVATMIPIGQTIEIGMGGREAAMPLWWALLMGACYGGNGTLIGASANVVVAGIAAKQGHKIGFIRFMFWGVPVVIVTTLLSSLYLYFRY